MQGPLQKLVPGAATGLVEDTASGEGMVLAVTALADMPLALAASGVTILLPMRGVAYMPTAPLRDKRTILQTMRSISPMQRTSTNWRTTIN